LSANGTVLRAIYWNKLRALAKVSLVGDGVIHVDQCWKFLGAEPFG